MGLKRIGEIVTELLATNKPAEIANTLEVSQAMVSTWKNLDNDYTPKFAVAQRLYREYGYQVWPYDLESLNEA